MRHTRNRQLRKINSFMTSPFTLTIEDSKYHIWDDTLDKSFMWIRYQTYKHYPVRNYYVFDNDLRSGFRRIK